MCFLCDNDFRELLYRETKKNDCAYQLLGIMCVTAFSASILGMVFVWNALRYEEARVFVGLFCLFNLLFACYTIFDTVIDPFGSAIKKWRRQEKLKLCREMLNTSPLFSTSINVPEIERETTTTSSPVPILTLSRSPRPGSYRLEEARQTVSSTNAPETADSPVPVFNLSRSPRRLCSRPRTLDIQRSTLPVRSSVYDLVVPVEVHRADESSSSEEGRINPE